MSKRLGRGENPAESVDATKDSSDRAAQPVLRHHVPTADLLAYMSDMLSELHAMSDQQRWPTLSGLLALAQAEASIQRDEIRARGRR